MGSEALGVGWLGRESKGKERGAHSIRMTSQPNSDSLFSSGYSEWALPKDEGENRTAAP